MIDVVPLKYGVSFKRIFGKPEVFSRFASDVLDMPLKFNQIHTEYEYPEPIGFVRSQYDLFAEDEQQRIIVEIQHVKESDFFDRFFYYHLISLVEQVKGFNAYRFDHTVYTIVVLTSTPRDQSIDFSYAATDWNPVDEYGQKKLVYPHRLLFLAPRLVNEQTPPKVRQWLKLIADSLDGKVNESEYQENLFQEMLKKMRSVNISRDELAAIKDEAAWEQAQAQARKEGQEEGREEGREEGFIEGKAAGIAEGEAKGELAGKIAAKRESLERLLEKKFSPLPDAIRDKISTADATQLDIWFERTIDAQNLESVFTE